MLVSGISRLGARTSFARRTVTAARESRPPTSASVRATAQWVEVIDGDERDVDDISAESPQPGMTLAEALAAYASN